MDRPKVPKPCQMYKWWSVDDRYIGSAFVLRTADGCYNVICGGLDNRGRIILRSADEDWKLFASEFVDEDYELVPLVPWREVE